MQQLLKTHFGYDSFRPLQAEIIQNVLAKKDSFVLMPTGGGKSLCYQLPALKLPGLTLVISPLIALMKDQVDALKLNGISAAFLNSSLTARENTQVQKDVLSGQTKILYVAPERLALDSFQSFLAKLEQNQTNAISLIAIDEAHCISEWGHDFRPDYRNLKRLKQDFPHVPLITLTATALEKQKNESVIVYCFSRKDTENIAENLKLAGYKAVPYHAGLSNEERKHNQDLFIKDKVDIIVATIAFGMGIDKPDVRLVVHHCLPKTLEGYYQEVGRAGRDGLASECVLFYSYADKMKHEFFINQIEDQTEKENVRAKLNQVIDFCEASVCRRKAILSYFDENYLSDNCQNCDFCLSEKEVFDATEITQKILSCILHTGSYFGKNYIIDVLKGSKSKQILQNAHNELSVYGIVQDFSANELKEIFQALMHLGLIRKQAGQYPTYALTEQGQEVLKTGQKIELPKPRKDLIENIKKKVTDLDYNSAIFEKLRGLRKELADIKGVPPFMIFGDVSLQEMAYYLPISSEDFKKITGVGIQKLDEFGKVFIELIQVCAKEHNLKPIEIIVRREFVRQSNRVANSRYQKTKELILQKKSLDEIAKAQGVQKGTIVGHLEKLISSSESLDLNHLKPSQESFDIINNAFLKCGTEKLKPVYEFLNENYSYDEIKLVRLFTK